MEQAIEITGLSKVYDNGFHALKNINLTIRKGEIFALLGPNGAGKTTLINIVCGISNPTQGNVLINGYDTIKAYKQARSLVGLVPQELTSNAFERVWDTVSFSRGLFGKPPKPAHIENVLKTLSLWEKRKNKIMTLSGGMKRRVLIAKALSHEPEILFLDEPTAGVDVSLRKEMWEQVESLRASGVTIILTTHYIEEAEEMADRIGVINKGQIILVEEKERLMQKLGIKELVLELRESLPEIPSALRRFNLSVKGTQMVYRYESQGEETGIEELLHSLRENGIYFRDFRTNQSSLEDIFVKLVGDK
jgi:ABC-2 type transport system ATP-binding protein